MKDEIRDLNWRRLIVVSVLLAAFIGAFDTYGTFSKVYGNLPTPTCQDGGVPDGCTSNGCRKSSGAPDSFWVCNYTGPACPPLEQCNP